MKTLLAMLCFVSLAVAGPNTKVRTSDGTERRLARCVFQSHGRTQIENRIVSSGDVAFLFRDGWVEVYGSASHDVTASGGDSGKLYRRLKNRSPKWSFRSLKKTVKVLSMTPRIEVKKG